MRGLLLVVLLLAACPGGNDDDGGGAADAAPPTGDATPATDATPVGRPCAIGFDDAGAGTPTLVATPALECPELMCAHVEGTAPDLCTRECTTPADCAPDLATPCGGGFACTVLVDVGPFAGRSFCVCAAYL